MTRSNEKNNNNKEKRAAAGAGLARQQARGSRGSRRGASAARRYGARAAGASGLGVLLSQQAVHLVHSACFDPVSTQYCS